MSVLRGIWFELQHLNRNLELLRIQEKRMSQATDNLANAVRRETDVVSSVTTLISGLAAQIKQAASNNDMTQVQQLADQINQNSDTLASAVTANTPAAQPGGTGAGFQPSGQ